MISDVSHWAVDWTLPVGYEIVTHSNGLEEELTIINASFLISNLRSMIGRG